MKFSAMFAGATLLPAVITAFVTPLLHHHNIHHTTQPLSSSFVLFAADEFSTKSISAAERYSGGPIDVELDTYNLALDDACREWTATKVVNSAKQPDGVYLDVTSTALVYSDVVTVRIQRQAGQGLGVELLQVQGEGRDDGVGITVVSGLVAGSVSQDSGLVPGDSLTKLAVVTGVMERELAVVNTECCNWDKTVEMIGSLPPPNQDDDSEVLLVTVKRLRRKPTVTIQVDGDQSLQVLAGENLRRAMLTRGVAINDKYAKAFEKGNGMGDCGFDGGCGLCTVQVAQGAELLNEPSPEEQELFQDQQSNQRWSCRAIVGYGMKEGTMVVQLNPDDN